MKAIFCKKVGMTRVVDESTGALRAVTVLKSDGVDVLQVKSLENDGYESCVLGFDKKESRGKVAGKQYARIGESEIIEGIEKGGRIEVKDFEGVEDIVVTGNTKGRGFSGVVKRWGFSTGRATHGSHHHREPGSIGQCSKPGRVFKGKKLPGRYGNTQKTLRLKLAGVVPEKNVLLVYGSVPGPNNSILFVKTA